MFIIYKNNIEFITLNKGYIKEQKPTLKKLQKIFPLERGYKITFKM